MLSILSCEKDIETENNSNNKVNNDYSIYSVFNDDFYNFKYNIYFTDKNNKLYGNRSEIDFTKNDDKLIILNN